MVGGGAFGVGGESYVVIEDSFFLRMISLIGGGSVALSAGVGAGQKVSKGRFCSMNIQILAPGLKGSRGRRWRIIGRGRRGRVCQLSPLARRPPPSSSAAPGA